MDQYESFEEISRKKIIYFFNPRAKNAGFDLGILASTAPPNGLRGVWKSGQVL